MSFHLVTVNDTNAPSRATSIRNLRLGGPDGVVAKFVSGLGATAEAPWQMPEEATVEMAGGTSGYDVIFFRPGPDVAPDGSIEIYRLESLHGVSSSDRTDLVCHFAPMIMRESGSGVWDLESCAQKTFCESISLTGGIKGGRWQWTTSPMTLGAAVVGGNSCAGHCESHEPASCCGSCH